jgi:hypothetical protein
VYTRGDLKYDITARKGTSWYLNAAASARRCNLRSFQWFKTIKNT